MPPWETIVTYGLSGVALYLGLGVLFALVFLVRGVEAVDSSAHGASWGFRALIFPGAVALWPLLAQRWFAARSKRRGEGS